MKIPDQFKDNRPWKTRTAEWLLSCLRLRIELGIGQLDLVLRVRYNVDSFSVHELALILRCGLRQLGFIVERSMGRTVHQSRQLRLYAVRWYKEINFNQD